LATATLLLIPSSSHLSVPDQARKAVYQLEKMGGSKEVKDYVFFPKANEPLKCKEVDQETSRPTSFGP